MTQFTCLGTRQQSARLISAPGFKPGPYHLADCDSIHSATGTAVHTVKLFSTDLQFLLDLHSHV